ncbi:hypothetical protein [Sulfuracidifex tepidarius]|nr:hypothetical protein [Sulfuracidifex tepidarius]
MLGDVAEGISSAVSAAASSMASIPADINTITQLITQQTTSNCLQDEVKKAQPYTYYPALAVTNRVSRGAKTLYGIVRHGMIVREQVGEGDDAKYLYYYVGGKSPDWIASSSLDVFQGGAQFFLPREKDKGGKINPLTNLLEQADSNVIVTTLDRVAKSSSWIQINPPSSCNGALGDFLQWTQTNHGTVSMMPNYV